VPCPHASLVSVCTLPLDAVADAVADIVAVAEL